MLRLFRIKTRLLISFFIMAFFTLIVGLTGFIRLTSIAHSAVKTVHNVTILNDIYDHNAAIDGGVYSMVFVSDITLSRYVVQTTKENMEVLLEKLNEYLKFQNQFSDVFTPGEMQDMANLLEIYEENYLPVLYEIFNLVEQGRREEALSVYINRLSPIYDTFTYYLNVGFTKNLQYSEIKTARNNESASLSANLMLVVVLISLIVSVVLALTVTKSIAKPLSEVESAAEKIAKGEIDERSYSSIFNDFNSNDEITHLSKRLKETLLQMTQVQRLKLDAAEARNEKEKAEALARSKGDFLAKMSHEIRTPMNAITGMAELALREDLPQTASEHILTIKQASANLLSIINDILDFSKIESGKLEIIPVDYLFSSLINDVISIIRTRVIDSDIQFVVNADCNIPNALLGDETRVRQIFLNILSNAVKYTEKGFVSLSVAAKANLGETGENIVTLRIEVTDSGKGIKRENIEQLFRDFVQFDLTSNRGIEGTGLGLAITRNLVKAMGGDISVNSEYGRGSTFTVMLPQKVGSHEKHGFVKNPEDKSVLLYEQREIYSDSILRTLENLGVNCALVTDDSQFREKTKNQAWPFVFISSDLLENAANILSEYKSGSKIVALAKFGEVFADKNLSILAMPAYSVSVANTLNGVNVISTFNTNKKSEVTLTAPDARVLIVDDINTNLKVAEGLMQPYKMLVDLCKSGLDAIEAVKQKYYDIVFMDHMMPEMDGVEATALIRAWEKDSGRRQVPVVALTANAVVGMREMFMENGFNDLLTKPIDVFQLDEMLVRWIPDEKWEQGGNAGSGEQRAMSSEQGSMSKVRENDGQSGNSSNSSFLIPNSSFSSIPGIDTAKGIAMTGGTEAGYRAVLAMFAKDAEDRLPLLQNVPEESVLPAFTTQVHALKSASASIGAAELSAEAAALEAAGKSGDIAFIKNNLPEFAKHLTQLTKNTRTALESANPPIPNSSLLIPNSSSPTPDSRLPTPDSPIPHSPLLIAPCSLLIDLSSALKSQNAAEIDSILEELNKKQMDSKIREALEQISDAVLMTEFGAALEIAQSLIDKSTETVYHMNHGQKAYHSGG